MAFSMGGKRLGKFVKMKTAIIEKDWKRAAEEGRDSIWHRYFPQRNENFMKVFDELAKKETSDSAVKTSFVIKNEPGKNRVSKLSMSSINNKSCSTEKETEELQEDWIQARKNAREVYESTFVLLPNKAQEALTDMAYVLGKQGLASFVLFKEAVENKNWEKAGIEGRDSAWNARDPETAGRIFRAFDELHEETMKRQQKESKEMSKTGCMLGGSCIGCVKVLFWKKISESDIIQKSYLPGRRAVARESARTIYEEIFDELPFKAQEALTEMVMAVGKLGLESFVRMKVAIQRRDWREAAFQSRDSRFHARGRETCERIMKNFEELALDEDNEIHTTAGPIVVLSNIPLAE
eukprot:snap_masked-scaffold_35-processed-gene-2.12-mRNA-1 protein AED:1.00 eAED:1.00 QI:0/0/0/0/1/1/2/0/350